MLCKPIPVKLILIYVNTNLLKIFQTINQLHNIDSFCNSILGAYDTKVFTLVFVGLICVINELKAEDFILEKVYLPTLKTYQLELREGLFSTKKSILNYKQHFLRFQKIFNSVYNTYETNRKWNINLRANLRVIEIAPWNDVCILIIYSTRSLWAGVCNSTIICQGVFIDRFIFRSNLLWMRLPWECHNQSQNTNWRHSVTEPELPFFHKRKGVLKIDQSVKMPWHRLSMRVASSCSSAPDSTEKKQL